MCVELKLSQNFLINSTWARQCHLLGKEMLTFNPSVLSWLLYLAPHEEAALYALLHCFKNYWTEGWNVAEYQFGVDKNTHSGDKVYPDGEAVGHWLRIEPTV